MDEKIARIIDKWLLTETQNKLVNEDLEDTPSNNVCRSVIPVIHKFCRAILRLVDANYTLPAMALLRVLAELTLRTCWCFVEPEPDVKVSRWLKQSFIERKKLLERMVIARLIPNNDNEECLKEIKDLAKCIDSAPHDAAGGLWSCIKELPEAYKDKYQLHYGVMNRAIHPDILVLRDTIRQEGAEMIPTGDFSHITSNELLKHCLNIVYEVVVHIQTYYKWDTTNLKTEHLQIVNSLTDSNN